MKRLLFAGLALMLASVLPSRTSAVDISAGAGLCITMGGASCTPTVTITPPSPPVTLGWNPFSGVISFDGPVAYLPSSMSVDNVPFQHVVGLTGFGNASVSYTIVADSVKGIMLFPPLDSNGNVDPSSIVTLATGASSGPTGVVVDDLDGDGNDDIVAVNGNDSSLSVFYGHSDGSFSAPVLVPLASSPSQFVLADIDGDGHPDLLVPDASAGVLDVYLNDGHGGFATPAPMAAGNRVLSVAAADVDGDGDVDLVVGDDDGTVDVLLNDGHGTFAQTSYPAKLRPDHVSFGEEAFYIISVFGSPSSPAVSIAAWSDTPDDIAASLAGNNDGTFQSAVLHTEKGCSFGYSLTFTCTAAITPAKKPPASGSSTSTPAKPVASAVASSGGGGIGLLGLTLLGLAGLARRLTR